MGREVGWIAAEDGRTLIASFLGSAAAGTLAGSLRPIPRLVAARLLDRTHRTEGRIAAAVELVEEHREDAWTAAALADACALAPSLRAGKAAPIRAPRNLLPLLTLAAAVALLAPLEISRPIEVSPVRRLAPVVLHDDDLEAFEEPLRRLLERSELAPEVGEYVEAFHRILEDLAGRRIDRAETLRRLGELEAPIVNGPLSEPTLFRDELRAMGRTLGRAALGSELGTALSEVDLAAAEHAARDLAKRLRSERLDRREIERLRRALEGAARARERGRGEADPVAEHETETERLLRRREQEGMTREERDRLFEQRRRELERLRREHEREVEVERRLDRLRREFEEAARALGTMPAADVADRADASLERAAEDLNRMAREQMTEKQLRAVARQIAERRQLIARLRPDPRDGESDDGRERVRRGSAGDDLSRRDRFVLRARGRDEDESEGMPVGVRGPPGARGSVGHGGNTSGGGTPGGELARASGRGGSPHGDDSPDFRYRRRARAGSVRDSDPPRRKPPYGSSAWRGGARPAPR